MLSPDQIDYLLSFLERLEVYGRWLLWLGFVFLGLVCYRFMVKNKARL